MLTMNSPLRRLIPIALLAAAWPALASGSDVVGENLLWLAIIILAARLFAPLTQRIGFPAVLGELLLGVVLALSSRTRRMAQEPVSIDLDVFAPGGARAISLFFGER